MASNNKNFRLVPQKETKNDSTSELKRRFHSNPFVFVGTFITLVIVIIAFVLVPAIVPNAGTLDANKLTFGYYKNNPIIYTGSNYFAQARQQYNAEAPNYGWDEYTVWQQAYKAQVIRTAALYTVKKTGYKPPESLVNKKTSELPIFQDENGRFSRALYTQMPPSERLALINDVNNNLILTRFWDDMFNIRISEQEKEFIGRMAQSQRNFLLAAFPYSSYPDEEVAAFAEKNPDIFVSVHFSQISAAKESEAKKILKSIEEGALTFEDAARNQSKDQYASRGGDAGAKLFYEIKNFVKNAEDAENLAKLEKGKLSAVIQTSDGWAIFRAEEDAKPIDASDSTAISQIRSYIDSFERGLIEDHLFAKAQELSDKAQDLGKNGFEEAAANAGVTAVDFGPLPINYGDASLFSTLTSFGAEAFQSPYSDPKAGASYDENFWKTAYTTALNATSLPIALNGRQNYVALIYPYEETKMDFSAKENSKSMFESWSKNVIAQDMEDTILSSPQHEDNFEETFKYLFPEIYYQHSFSSFNY
ncbi:MAG: peptidylprolyl isomerase [Spirochaetaceae bacterium]|jgi:parvulin-like peptidyl-prolyl isomerase|nr:peptidylprolyl isomerase [Spirochaetaceae bacterium]